MSTCINGGTATFTPFLRSEFYSGGDRDGWYFEFDDCQYDATVFEGMAVREKYRYGSLWLITSTGLTIKSQTGRTNFFGSVNYKPGTLRGGSQVFYYSVDVDYTAAGPVEPVEMSAADFGVLKGPHYNDLSGEFSVTSEVTDGKRLDVKVIACHQGPALSTVESASNLDQRFVPLGLSVQDISQLTAFLTTGLHDPNLERYEPEYVPSGSCITVDAQDGLVEYRCNYTAP